MPLRAAYPRIETKAGVWTALAVLLASLLPMGQGPAQAATSWPSWPGAAQTQATGLAASLAAIRATPENPAAPALALDITPEGHWQFANRAGEVFTAGTPAELARVPAALAPDGKDGFASIRLVLSQDSLFAGAAVLRDMPSVKELTAVIGGEALGLRSAGRNILAVSLRPGVYLPATDKDTFLEALAQLRRPLDASRLRVLSAATGGPAALPVKPRFDEGQGGAAIDLIDPDRLASALPALARQTAILTARLDGPNLTVQPPSGPERILPLASLTGAAASADADLLILHADPPRQPGGRNWLWQRIQVSGLEHATKRGTLADFLDQLASARGGPFSVNVAPDGDGRVRLTAQPIATSLVTTEGVTGWIKQAAGAVTGQVTGSVQPASVYASLVADARRRELGLRLLPGLPSTLTAVYLAAAILGLLALPVARRWWRRIWPVEARSEYASAQGYAAARAIRALAFLALFLPLAALPAILTKLVELVLPHKPQVS